jgi:tetratricopeptide (TPR) repeat protein
MLAKLTLGDWLGTWGIVATVVTTIIAIVVSILLSRREKNNRENELIEKLINQGKREEGLLDEVDILKTSLRNAILRAKGLTKPGRKTEAEEAIKELRKSGDMAKLQALLIADRDKHGNAMIERNHEIAAVAFLRGDINVASDAVEQVLQNKQDDMESLNQKGMILILRGDGEGARKCYEKLLVVANSHKDDGFKAAALGNLAHVYFLMGELGKAEAMCREALAIAQRQGRLDQVTAQYSGLGLIYESRGKFDIAVSYFLESLRIDLEHGDLQGIAAAYGNLGIVYCRVRDFDRAEKMCRKSLEAEEQMGRREGITRQYGNLGTICLNRGKLDEAEAWYQKALEISQELGYQLEIANNYKDIGTVNARRKNKAKAREYWLKALELYKKVGMAPEVQQIEVYLKLLDKL